MKFVETQVLPLAMQEAIARVPTNPLTLEDVRGAACIVRLRIATSIPAISAAEFDLISQSPFF